MSSYTPVNWCNIIRYKLYMHYLKGKGYKYCNVCLCDHGFPDSTGLHIHSSIIYANVLKHNSWLQKIGR